MLVRFDDTNPSKEKGEYAENIMKDLVTLGIKPHAISHSSDHFEVCQELARKMILEGKVSYTCYILLLHDLCLLLTDFISLQIHSFYFLHSVGLYG
jgi:hypothetical protein